MDPDKSSSQSEDLNESHIDEPSQNGDDNSFPTLPDDLQECSEEPMQTAEKPSSQTANQEV